MGRNLVSSSQIRCTVGSAGASAASGVGHRLLGRCFTQRLKDFGQRRELSRTGESNDADHRGRDAARDRWLGAHGVESLPVRRTVIVNLRVKQRLELRDGATDS